ncbi:SDR family oxidoreductase [Actinoplanes sp. NPDC049596]|uniref:SDR family NAD(P)-dependent oxidoreductase n=1 Tax=unclassified Actinoplanes TaxID=2626549 RepID=UPI00343C78B8
MKTSAFDFTDSVVLVTGGGSGIGAAIAAAFLEAGATVVVTGRRLEALRKTLAGHPLDRAHAISADVSDSAQIRALIAEIVDRFGRLDVVVSNAGTHALGEITDLSDDQWEVLRSTNIDGFFHLAKAVLPHLERSGGNLVAISSVSGDRGDWRQSAYNASKAAITNFVRSLALDWGPRGVRLNVVAPAFTVTELTAGAVTDEHLVAAAINRITLGRLAEPTDVAPAVLFLASDEARYITGAVLAVDGGTSASTGQAH